MKCFGCLNDNPKEATSIWISSIGNLRVLCEDHAENARNDTSIIPWREVYNAKIVGDKILVDDIELLGDKTT